MTTTAPGPAHHTVRVTGMTCAACERRVAKAVGGIPGVQTATASAQRGRITITGDRPDDAPLAAALAAAGYALGTPAWITRDRRVWATVTASAVAVAVAGWALGRSGVGGWGPSASLTGPVLGLLVGLAAGVSTCMALVGGLVLAVSASASASASGDDEHASAGRRALRAQLAFTAGRWAAFAAGGGALGAAGSAARLPVRVTAVTILVAAAVTAVLGVRLTGLSPRVSGWSLTLPAAWADRFGSAGHRGAALAGAATFLLPCGFTQAMQVSAIALGSPGPAAALMLAFAVGTTPGLLGLGLLGGVVARRSTPVAPPSGGSISDAPAAAGAGRAWTRAIGVVVVAFAAVTGIGGLNALGLALPGPALFRPVAPEPTTVSANVRSAGTTQIVTLTQSSDGYRPADTVVWAGVPIRWQITATSGFVCTSVLNVPSLGISVDMMHTGNYEVALPALRRGTTRFTCSMGMYSGTLRAIARPASGS